jgi:uncharacterized protein (DUF302 family)
MLLVMSGYSVAGGDQMMGRGPMTVYQSEEPFEDVIDNIKMAIEERGMLVSGVLHISDMLNRTGPDLGYGKVFEKAESVEFCSASLSHKMVQVAPENLTVCPFTIAVFAKAGQPGRLFVAYRRPQLLGKAEAVTHEIIEMLDGIVKDSIE